MLIAFVREWRRSRRTENKSYHCCLFLLPRVYRVIQPWVVPHTLIAPIQMDALALALASSALPHATMCCVCVCTAFTCIHTNVRGTNINNNQSLQGLNKQTQRLRARTCLWKMQQQRQLKAFLNRLLLPWTQTLSQFNTYLWGKIDQRYQKGHKRSYSSQGKQSRAVLTELRSL